VDQLKNVQKTGRGDKKIQGKKGEELLIIA
jgi:hypothetical protein